MFEVEFTSPVLTAQDRDDLGKSLISVSTDALSFKVSVDSKKLVPLDALIKLAAVSKDRPTDLNVNILSPDGTILSTVVYKKCVFDVDFRSFLMMNYNGSFGNGMEEKTVSISFRHEKVMLNQLEISI